MMICGICEETVEGDGLEHVQSCHQGVIKSEVIGALFTPEKLRKVYGWECHICCGTCTRWVHGESGTPELEEMLKGWKMGGPGERNVCVDCLMEPN